MTNVLLVGGTSAGHLAPMVAVAEALETIEPGIHLSFICSDKPSDAAFLTLEKRPCKTLPLPRRNISLPFTFLRAFVQSFTILSAEKPDVVFSKGSAVSVSLCIAARLKGIPVILHESDAVMGHANRVISYIANDVLRGTEIGNPIRTRITTGNKSDGMRITGFSGAKPVLLVMGGSQGAQAINEYIANALDDLLKTVDVIHLTGAGKNVIANKPGYYATEFGSDILPHLYAITTLAISRAGAGSIAELAACGIPAILVPIKGLAGDHQVKNAEIAERHGSCVTLPQWRLQELASWVISLVNDPVTLQTMRNACRYTAKPEAARLIAETVLRSVARAGNGA